MLYQFNNCGVKIKFKKYTINLNTFQTQRSDLFSSTPQIIAMVPKEL